MSVDLHPRKRKGEASEMIEGSLVSQRRSGESVDVRSGRTSRITSPRKERIDTAYRRWEEPNFTRRPARKSSPVPQEEMSLTDYADLPPTTQYERKSDRESPFARTRIDTAYRRWEAPNFTRRPERKSSPVPQEEMSLTDYADLPPTTQYERKSDRESPFARTRIRPGPPLSPLRESEDFRKN